MYVTKENANQFPPLKIFIEEPKIPPKFTIKIGSFNREKI
jgi:hypothetical protein